MVNIKNARLETFPKNLRLDILALMTRHASNFFGVGGLKGVCTTSRPTPKTKERLIFSERDGRTLVRRYVRPRDPKSPHQLPQRARFKGGNRLWAAITEEQRVGWQAYAERHGMYPRTYKGQRGQRAFIRAATLKMTLALPIQTEPPTIAPPARPTRLVQEAAGAPDELAFRMEHAVKGEVSGWRVQVEMSPATLRPTRKPRECEIVWARGVGAASCPELLASGALYRLGGVRFRLLPGQRYAVRVSLITPEGIRGAELTADLLRGECGKP